MDFALPYTEEQERFRQEVRTWLQENIPEEMRDPIDPRDFTDEMYWFWREKHKEIAAKGWLYPTYPKEYGGGGLTGEHETIIEEEFERGRVWRNAANKLVLPVLLVWATEEQKQKFLVPILKAEKVSWQKFTEPQSGADLANYQGRAVRDGDDWVLTGQNVYTSGRGPAPDFLFGPMMTDPDSPRHRNLGYFMIPVPSPGLEIQEMNLVHGHEQHFEFLDNVRVPGDHLIGGDHQGWQVTNTTLEQEHGGRGQAFTDDEEVENLVRYRQEQRQKDGRPAGEAVAQQMATVDSYLDVQINTLMQKRTYWMYENRMEMSWEGPTTSLVGRLQRLDHTRRVRDVMGMYALLGTKDPRAPFGGAPEVDQRRTFPSGFGAGGLTITKVIIARRIGISRTKERAAPTPATATSYGS